MTGKQNNSIIEINSNELVNHINKFKSIAIYQGEQYEAAPVELINDMYNGQSLIIESTTIQGDATGLLIRPIMTKAPAGTRYDWKVIGADGFTDLLMSEDQDNFEISDSGLKIKNQWNIKKFLTVQAIAYSNNIYVAHSNVLTVYENSDDLVSAITIDLSNDNATVPVDTIDENIIKDLTKTTVTVLRGDSDLTDRCAYKWVATGGAFGYLNEDGTLNDNTKNACLSSIDSNHATLVVTITIPDNTGAKDIVLTKTMNIARGTRGANGKGIYSTKTLFAATAQYGNADKYPDIDNIGSTEAHKENPQNYWWTSIADTGYSATHPYLWRYDETVYAEADGSNQEPPKRTNPELLSYYAKEISEFIDWYIVNNDATDIPETPQEKEGANIPDEDWISLGWSREPQPTSQNTRYLWNCEVINYTNGDQTIKSPAIRGAEGIHGTPGASGSTPIIITGEDGLTYWELDGEIIGRAEGADGKSAYLHIRYSEYSNGIGQNGFSTIPNTYIGTCVSDSPNAPINANQYTWSRFTGIDGVAFAGVENWYKATVDLVNDGEGPTPPAPDDEFWTDGANTIQGSGFGSRVSLTDQRIYKYLWNCEKVYSYNAETKQTTHTWTPVELADTYIGGRIPAEYINYFAVGADPMLVPEQAPYLTDNNNAIVIPEGSTWVSENFSEIQADTGVYLFEKTFCRYEETDDMGENLYAVMGTSIAGYNGKNGTSPYTLSLNNDSDTIVKTTDGQWISNIEDIVVIPACYEGNQLVSNAKIECIPPNENWTNNHYTFENGQLSFKAIPEDYISGYFTFKWQEATDAPSRAEKKFNLKVITSIVDYDLIIDQTVFNNTYNGGTFNIRVLKKTQEGTIILEEPNQNDEIAIYKNLSDIALDEWSNQTYEQGQAQKIIYTLKSLTNPDIIWDEEVVNFIQDGENAVIYRFAIVNPVVNITNLTSNQSYQIPLQKIDGNNQTTLTELPANHSLKWNYYKNDGTIINGGNLIPNNGMYSFEYNPTTDADGLEIIWNDGTVILDKEQIPFIQDGSNYTGLVISSSAQAFKQTGNKIVPEEITLVAHLYGDLQGKTVTWTPTSSTGIENRGQSLYIDPEAVAVAETFTASCEGYEDSITLYRLVDGENGNPAITAFLTNQSIGFSADSNGIVRDTTKISYIKVYQGIQDITSKIAAISIPSAPQGVNITTNNKNAEINIKVKDSTMGSANNINGSWTFNIIIDGLENPIPLQINWTKIKDGKDGRAIKEVIEYYARSKNATTEPTASAGENSEAWSTEFNSPDSDWPYLWNYEVSNYDDDNPASTTKPIIIAYYTENGRGIANIQNYYLISNKTSQEKPETDVNYTEAPNSPKDDIWYTTAPATTETYPYLWNSEIITYIESDGTETKEVTDPAIIGTHGKKGSDGISIDVKYKNSETIPTIVNNNVESWSSTVPPQEKKKRTYMIQKRSNEQNWSTPIQLSTEDPPEIDIINGEWTINGEPTGIKAEGADGHTPTMTVGTNGNWFVDGKDTGVQAQGPAGKDGDMIEYVYYRSKVALPNLTAPYYDNNILMPNGWEDHPQGITEDYKFEYMSQRIKTNGVWETFSNPVIWSRWGEKGQDGDGVVYEYYLKNDEEPPIYNSSNPNWTDEPKGVSQENRFEYVVQIKGTEISTPTLWAKWSDDGISIEWKGELSSAPFNPQKNWSYKNTTDHKVYIYNGSSWELMTQDGKDGTPGTDGINGNSVFITYHDSPTMPNAPSGNGTTNGWHTNSTITSIWMSQKVAASVGEGAWGAPIKIQAQDGKDGKDGKDGTGVSIKGTAYTKTSINDNSIGVEYTLYSDKDGKNAITSVENGDAYLVNGYLFVYSGSGTNFVCTGKIQGEKGNDGVGVSNIINYYMASQRNSNVVSGTEGEDPDNEEAWTPGIQTPTAQKPYLWNYEEVYYTKGDPKSTDAIIIGNYSNDGRGIAQIEEFYCITADLTCDTPENDVLNSAESAPSSPESKKWYKTPPMVNDTYKYLWNVERITYTSGEPISTISTPAMIGSYGQKGNTGDNGTSPYIVVLDNDSATIGTDADGKYDSTLLATVSRVTATVFEGSTNINDLCKFTWSASGGTLSTTNTNATYFTKLDKVTATATVTVTKGQTLIGVKTFTISKNRQGANAVTYALSITPNSFNITDSTTITPEFTITKYEGQKVTKLSGVESNSGEYKVCKTGETNVWQGGPINTTTTFDLLIKQGNSYIKADSETVNATKNGNNGKNGRAVQSITEYYLTTNMDSDVTISTTGWKTVVEPVSASKKYLWNYEVTTFDDKVKADPTTPVIIARYTENGRGIHSIQNYYLINDGSAPSVDNITNADDEGVEADTWYKKAPTTTETNRYLWNSEVITYIESNGATAPGTPTPPALISVRGVDGTDGTNGSSVKKINTELRKFTYSQWTKYASIDHEEPWSHRGGNNSHINIDDTAYLIGEVTDRWMDSKTNQSITIYGTVTANTSSAVVMKTSSVVWGSAPVSVIAEQYLYHIANVNTGVTTPNSDAELATWLPISNNYPIYPDTQHPNVYLWRCTQSEWINKVDDAGNLIQYTYTEPILLSDYEMGTLMAQIEGLSLAEWCVMHSRTLIDGSSIATGSIKAQAIDTTGLSVDYMESQNYKTLMLDLAPNITYGGWTFQGFTLPLDTVPSDYRASKMPAIINGQAITEVRWNGTEAATLAVEIAPYIEEMELPDTIQVYQRYFLSGGLTNIEYLYLPFIGRTRGATGDNAKASYLFGSDYISDTLKYLRLTDTVILKAGALPQKQNGQYILALSYGLKEIEEGAINDSISQIYYEGTPEDWSKIIGNNNITPTKFGHVASLSGYEEGMIPIYMRDPQGEGFRISSYPEELMIDSAGFKVSQDGVASMVAGHIGGWEITSEGLRSDTVELFNDSVTESRSLIDGDRNYSKIKMRTGKQDTFVISKTDQKWIYNSSWEQGDNCYYYASSINLAISGAMFVTELLSCEVEVDALAGDKHYPLENDKFKITSELNELGTAINYTIIYGGKLASSNDAEYKLEISYKISCISYNFILQENGAIATKAIKINDVLTTESKVLNSYINLDIGRQGGAANSFEAGGGPRISLKDRYTEGFQNSTGRTLLLNPQNIAMYTGNPNNGFYIKPTFTGASARTTIHSPQGKISGSWTSTQSIIVDSDERIKNTIKPLTDEYSILFDNLEPVSYKYNNGTSDRTHTGFRAQNVKAATEAAGLTTKDFAAYCEYLDENENEVCGIRYEELIALCVKEIQSLKAEVKELKKQLKDNLL